MKFTINLSLLVAAVLLCVAFAPAANAQLTFTLDNAAQTGAPVSTLNFDGTLSNLSTTDPVDLNGDSLSFTGPATGLTLIDNFDTNTPTQLDVAGSGADVFDGDLFDVLIDTSAVPNTYYGTLDISASDDTTGADESISEDFSVTVLPIPGGGGGGGTPTSTPEPSGIGTLGLMLGLVACAIGWTSKRRRTARQS